MNIAKVLDENTTSRAKAALEALQHMGLDVHMLSDASIPVFEDIDHHSFGDNVLKDLYWLIIDKEYIPHYGDVGENYPCGVVIGFCAYIRLDYCWDEEVVKINICDYHAIMDLPVERRLYVGSAPLKQKDIIDPRIRKLLDK